MTIDAKIRALLAKTVKNGCTPAEQEAATAKARGLVKQYGLNGSDFTWPAPPKAEPKKAAKGAPRAPKAAKPGKAPRPRAKPATEPTKRATRGDEVVELLRRKNGATIAEMVTRFGLQPHSLRAIISVESRKRGLTVELVGRAHYRVVAQ
jgi:hypothetical protein